ncbi:MAG: hypothetical protein OES47_08915 [Acidobacteriota bacterium]|nr:hypothetical protein [Acidobacteriota bacterium]
MGNTLKRLEALKGCYGAGDAERKGELLRAVENRVLSRATEVSRLHEVLCFLRAYPDDGTLLEQVESMLEGFALRKDLRRHREALANSGIVGVVTYYRFFWFTALWLAQRFPDRLHIDWVDFDRKGLLESRLPVLMPYVERLALEEIGLPARRWIERLKNAEETDGAFVVRRFAALEAKEFVLEKVYEELDIPYRLEPGPGLLQGQETPNRSLAHYPGSPIVFQRGPLELSRKSFPGALRRPPVAEKALSPARAKELIDLAREAMIARQRDLDVFIHADPRDVRLLDCGRGLQFACYGTVPAWRQVLDSVYGFLILKNGVPIGYFLTSSLFRSSEVAYNIFDTYRGGEAAYVYGRGLAMVRHVFGSDSFVVDPYQMGHENQEALKSGAWWFYYKLGFRPHDPDVLRLVERELGKMKKTPRHRSSISTLEKLSAVEMFLHLGKPREDVLGIVSRESIGFRVSDYLAERFGGERERGVKACEREAAKRLGLRSRRGFSAGERLAWSRWAPLVMTLPRVERWSEKNRRAMVEVGRAKGGRRESDFVRLFDRHRPLRRAVLELAKP